MSDQGPPYVLPEGGAAPPPPAYGYGPPPGYPNYGYGPPPYGWDGPPGKIRPTGISIVLFVCTLGIYTFVYNYSVHSEMKRHSGRGIGGGVALLLSFLAYIAMPVVTAAEVGSLYSRRGRPQPVSGWTGRWVVVPVFVGQFLQFALVFLLFEYNSSAPFVVLLVIWLIALVGGALLWFIKTNDALNNYWASVGVGYPGRAA